MTQVVQDTTTNRTGRWRDDWPVAATAAGLAALGWLLASPVAGIDLTVRSGSGEQQVNLISVVVTAIVVAAAGAGLLRVLERRTSRALRLWTRIAVGLWVLSFAGPLGATSLAAGLALGGLHLIVGTVVVVGLRRRHAGRVA